LRIIPWRRARWKKISNKEYRTRNRRSAQEERRRREEGKGNIEQGTRNGELDPSLRWDKGVRGKGVHL